MINSENKVDEQGSKTIELVKGKYRLKNVGANAKEGKIRISVSSNPDVEIIKNKK